MNSSEKIPFTFEFNWKISALTLIFLPLMVGLGFWQLQRADEKNTIQQSLEQQQALPPLNLAEAEPEQLVEFRRIMFSGRPDSERIWLMENQIYQGKVGYHLLVPVTLNEGQTILVNAGWIQGSGPRNEMPVIPSLPTSAVFSGQLRGVSENRFLRDQRVNAGWPKRILQVDFPAMESALGKSLYPWVVQLDAASPMAQTVHWPVLNMSADKHIAYAVQWFLMAFALAILWVYANSNLGRRSSNKRNDKVTPGE